MRESNRYLFSNFIVLHYNNAKLNTHTTLSFCKFKTFRIRQKDGMSQRSDKIIPIVCVFLRPGKVKGYCKDCYFVVRIMEVVYVS